MRPFELYVFPENVTVSTTIKQFTVFLLSGDSVKEMKFPPLAMLFSDIVQFFKIKFCCIIGDPILESVTKIEMHSMFLTNFESVITISDTTLLFITNFTPCLLPTNWQP